MLHVEREIVINRPVDEVFDFVADGRNEPKYNPHTLHVEQTSDGPIGQGTRFRFESKMMGQSIEVVYEITAYERPQWFASRLIKALPIMNLHNIESFDPVPGGTRMRWSYEVELRGVFKMLTPMIARVLGRSMDTAFANLKRLLEAHETPLPEDLAVPAY